MMIIMLATTLLAGLIGLAVFVYYMKRGQFEQSEEVKYQLFHEDDE